MHKMTEKLQEILSTWNIRTTAEEVLAEWNRKGRYYHNCTHLFDLINKIQQREITEDNKNTLYLIAIFHDIVYDPKRQDNEEKSAEYFLSKIPPGFDPQTATLVYDSIMETKTHSPTSPLSEEFCKLDMSIVEAGYETLLEWENGIWFEYSSYGRDAYKAGRLKFLKSILEAYPANRKNLERLIAFIKAH